MLMNNTPSQLRDLKLAAMASAVEEQLSSAASTALSFEERLALMVDREVHHRGDKRRAAAVCRIRRVGLACPALPTRLDAGPAMVRRQRCAPRVPPL